MSGALYIGLMSGTSMDGVDGVLVDFSPPGSRPADTTSAAGKVLAHASAPFPASLRAELMALNQAGNDELHRAALAGNALVRVYADVVHSLLARTGHPTAQIRAVGAHGQTVRHRPGLYDGVGYTLQLNQPALLAELCGITVVADFRSRDVAAGGQGAPLVPAFHHAWFDQLRGPTAVLNLGGIANLTLQAPDGRLLGFDTGPGNVLLDAWCESHTGQAFDDGGRWAASGRCSAALLDTLLAEPYFAQPAPKSTGRDLFHVRWLDERLQQHAALSAADVQATLLELTSASVVQALMSVAPHTRELLVCGGGALNTRLIDSIRVRLKAWSGSPHASEAPTTAASMIVQSTQARGLSPQLVESTAFAWLAWQALDGRAANVPSVTGAHGSRILGAIYPA